MRIPDLEQGSDEELVAGYVKHGDRDALEVLLRRHESRVYGLAVRVLGNRDDARDVAQEVFVTLFRKAGSFKGTSAFTTWLYRLTMNACYDQGRRKARAPTPVEESEQHRDDRVSSVDDRMMVEVALSSLVAEQRVVVVMRDMYQMSYEEIAEATDVPVGTVKSRIARGRLALAGALKEKEPPALPDRLSEK